MVLIAMLSRPHAIALVGAPPLGALLYGLWRHRQLVAERAMDLVIHLLAVPADKPAGW